MSSKSIMSHRTKRSFTFSIGDHPKGHLRIASYLDHAWNMNIPNSQSICILEAGESPSSETLLEEPVLEEMGHTNRQVYHHRAASSASFPHFSTVSCDDEDIISAYLDVEPPSVETARVQYHELVPVRKLVYTSRSHATSNFSSFGASYSQSPRKSSEWTRELKTLFDYTWRRSRNGQATPVRPHTAHTSCPSTTRFTSASSMSSYQFPTPPETPSKPTRFGPALVKPRTTTKSTRARPHSQRSPRYNRRPPHHSPARRARHSPHRSTTKNISTSSSARPDLPRTHRDDLWFCQYSPAKAARVRPGWQDPIRDDNDSIEDTDSGIFHKGTMPRMYQPPPVTSPPVLFHLPFTPPRIPERRSHGTGTFPKGECSSPEADLSVKWSPFSNADTLINDDFVLENRKSSKFWDTKGKGSANGKGSAKGRFSRLWKKCFSGGKMVG